MPALPIETLSQAHAEFAVFHRTITALAPDLRRALRGLPLPIARGMLDHLAALEAQLPHVQLALDLLARTAAHLPAGVRDPSTAVS